MRIDRAIYSVRTAPRSALRVLFGLFASALLLAAPGLGGAQTPSFDHVTTGWPLTGMHENVRCETCHIKAIFKGTPRTCSFCHSQNDSSRGAKAMPVNHIVVPNQTCDTCHSTSTFLGVLFSHVTVVPGTCNSCHDGIHSIGKPAGHVPTTASCDACHKTSAFVPIVTFNHIAWLNSPDKGGWTCTNCHDGRFAPGKPSNHIPSPAATTCETCHFAPNTNPGFTSFAGGEMDHVNVTTNCGQCHAPAVAGSFVGVQIRSSTGLVPPHVPTTVTTCETCHQSPPPVMPIPVSGAASVGGTTFAGGLMSHAGITNNCATCHGPNVMAGTFYGVVPKTSNGLSPQHMPTTLACEVCHTNAIPSMLIPGSGATAGMTTFAGGQMSHTGITAGCANCHGPTISGNSFFGISSIVVMPPVSPVGVNSHIPSSTTCETCHAGSAPAGLVPGNSTKTAPGTLFATPVPTSAQIHTGVTASCSACHDTNFVWMGVTSYPITTSTPFKGFQTRPQVTAGTFFVADGGHPTAGDCSSCHGGFTDFNGYSKPANHIPYAAAAQCTACHTTTDYSALPTLTNIHANAPSTTSNCAQCHSPAAAASYAIPTANFAIVTTNSAGTKHIPLGSQDCSVCHVGASSSTLTPVVDGATFGNSAMSHSGITNNCVACHGAGITAATFTGLAPVTNGGLSPAHMPTTVSCETCHGNAIPSMLIPATGAGAGMTTFVGGQMSHTGITTNCVACHGPTITGSSFFGITNIVVMPAISPMGVSSHIPSSTTCETCHLGTTPAGLIAGNAAAATVPGSKFATPAPTSAQIHTGVTGGCSACHETSFVWMGVSNYPINPKTLTAGAQYMGFNTRPGVASTYSIADAGHPTSGDCSNCHNTTDFSGYSKPTNHIPYAAAAACTACHTNNDYSVLPTLANIHANAQSTTTNCAQCHSPANAAGYAIPFANFAIVSTNSAGVSHIPLGTQDCSLCHVGASSSTLTPVPNGALFGNSAMSHTGITNNCAACHGAMVTASTFTGIAPKTSSGLSPNHMPTTAACELCHANAIPSMLIPASGAATGMTTFTGGQMSHTGITSACAVCHGPTITGSSFFGISKIVVMPAVTPVGVNSHIPSSTTCETCHLGTTPAGLIAGNAASTTLPGSKFATPIPTGAQIHTGVTSGCAACHETSFVWMGVSNYPIKPTTLTAGALYTGFNTRPGVASTYSIADAGHPTSGDCSNCHNTTDFSGYSKPTNHIPYAAAAACTACHTNPDYSVMPSLATIHANAQSTTSNCAQCHSPANAANYAIPSASFAIVTTTTTGIKHIPLGTQDCSVCHVGANSSTVTPVPNGAKFTNSATSHTGITTNCAACHGSTITASTFTGISPKTLNGLSPKHITTTAACELCHSNAIPSMLIPATGAGTGMTTFANGQFSHTGITTGCVACHGPTITAASFFGITKIVVMPAVTPVGVNSHIPSSTTCETCHLGTTPAGLLPGNAASIALPGSKFLTPLPTSAQIHTGVTGGCAACHETNYVWMDVSSYPITRTAPFTGFQVRPAVAAGTYTVADAAHPGSGDCSNCHGSFTDFAGVSKPSNHIPYAAAAACTACHTSTNYAVMPTLASIHANAQSTTSNCNQCHSATNAAAYAIPSVLTIKSTNSTGVKHIPLATQDCSLCHVGAGTGVPTLPVTNTALFNNSKMSHTGFTSNCASCHGPTITNSSFTGITQIIVMPATSPAGLTHHIPSSTVCETCHLGSTPAGLIAANAASATLPGSLFATPVPSTVQIHTGVSTGCSSCHDTGFVWMGMTRYPISPTTTAGGTANTQYVGFQTRPVAAASTYSVADGGHPAGECSNCHTGTTYFSGQAKPNGHIPTNAACAICHVVAGNFSVTGLTTNYTTLHTGISSGCISCHTAGAGAGPFAGCATPAACASPPPLTYQPKMMPLAAGGSPTAPSASTHVPATGIACEKCHTPTVFTAFSGMQMKSNTPAHTAIAAYTCITCHEGTPKYVWYGVTIRTEPVGHEGRKAGQDCAGSGCHSKTKFSSFMELRVRTIMRAAIGSVGVGPRVLPDGTVIGSTPIAGSRFNHQGVLPGQCATCHNGKTANGLPPKHIVTRASCDTCHRNTTWVPAAFNHAGISVGTCASCHDGLHGPGKPSAHFVTVRSCDACHRKETWIPVSYSHLSPAYQPRPDALTCVSCHVTNGEIVPRQLRVRPRNLPLPQ